jgi:ATP-dependent 26S proteasome regulatory subunit
MGKNAAKTRQQKGSTQSQQPYSNQESELFFNKSKRHASHSLNMQPTRKKQKTEHSEPTEEITLNTTTDILLAGILEELRTQNMIAIMKLKAQEVQEQKELEAAEKMQEEDKVHFEEIRHTMYN